MEDIKNEISNIINTINEESTIAMIYSFVSSLAPDYKGN